MTKAKKIMLSVVCAGLLVVGSVAATIAYLTDQDRATNTFTVGNVQITLDEAKVNADGIVVPGAERVTENTYHLIPGQKYVKDPTVTVEGGSEDCYVRAMVTVQSLEQLKAALPNSGETAKYYAADGTFLLQMLVEGWDSTAWEFVKANGNVYEFRYADVVVKKATDTVLPDLFTHLVIPGEIDNVHLAELDEAQVVVKAHAIQKAGFDDADAAWEAFDGQNSND